MQAYEYDIPCCFPRILLEVLEYDFLQLRKILHDKQKRSRFIGYLVRSQPKIGQMLRAVTDTIIDEYISQIGNHNVIIRKLDGFICRKPLISTTCSLLSIELRYEYIVFIHEKNKYVGLTSKNKCIVKGVRDKTIGLHKWWYDVLANLDALYLQSKVIEYFTTNDLDLFAIPIDNNKYMFRLRNNKIIEVSEYKYSILDIDREYYYKHHILPFIRVLLTDTFKNDNFILRR